ncbi:MAG: hypothetical protein ACI8P3_002791 [Saprospiraceae bacterium]|jgi:uncharacterized protein YcaQ
MLKINLKTAQSFIIGSQLLSGSSSLKGKEGTQQVIEQLGYIQIDTISVIARAHHHVLFTRVPDYQPATLKSLEEEDRQIFEYWAHAASYLPMKDFRYSLVAKGKIKAGEGHWRKRDKKWMKWVLDQIKAEGPKMGRDFEKEKNLSFEHAWGGHPVNQALRQLFMEGEIMVAGRKGFQKVYDLTERVLPDTVDTKMPSEADFYKYLIRRDVSANGLMKAREIGHLVTIPKESLQTLLHEMTASGELAEVLVKELGSDIYYASKEKLSTFPQKPLKKHLKMLSPFDNLVIQRKRMEELFGFNYTLECYVPAAKRKIGYFSLPLLWGTEFVGQIDLKADRKSKVLIVKNLVWEENIKDKEKLRSALKSALIDFRDFNACENIDEQGKFS